MAMAHRLRLLSLILPCLPAASLAAGPEGNDGRRTAKALTDAGFARLHELMKPHAGEWAWAEVPWMRPTDIWAARRKAADEGKPVLLWYMAGEPLGPC